MVNYHWVKKTYTSIDTSADGINTLINIEISC